MKMCAQDIEFTLIRSERKTADIVIERSGDVVVRAPAGIDDDTIRHIVADRALWVHRTLAEWVDLNASRRHRPLVQGQGFAYLGRSYRLKFVSGIDVPLRLKNGNWELSEAFVKEQGEAAVRKAFRDFYLAKGEQILTNRVAHFSPLVGVKPRSIAVRELGYHWASCGTSGALNFNWKALMAPQTVIDYVVVHELAICVTATTPMHSGTRSTRSSPDSENARNGCGAMGPHWTFDLDEANAHWRGVET